MIAGLIVNDFNKDSSVVKCFKLIQDLLKLPDSKPFLEAIDYQKLYDNIDAGSNIENKTIKNMIENVTKELLERKLIKISNLKEFDQDSNDISLKWQKYTFESIFSSNGVLDPKGDKYGQNEIFNPYNSYGYSHKIEEVINLPKFLVKYIDLYNISSLKIDPNILYTYLAKFNFNEIKYLLENRKEICYPFLRFILYIKNNNSEEFIQDFNSLITEDKKELVRFISAWIRFSKYTSLEFTNNFIKIGKEIDIYKYSCYSTFDKFEFIIYLNLYSGENGIRNYDELIHFISVIFLSDKGREYQSYENNYSVANYKIKFNILADTPDAPNVVNDFYIKLKSFLDKNKLPYSSLSKIISILRYNITATIKPLNEDFKRTLKDSINFSFKQLFLMYTKDQYHIQKEFNEILMKIGFFNTKRFTDEFLKLYFDYLTSEEKKEIKKIFFGNVINNIGEAKNLVTRRSTLISIVNKNLFYYGPKFIHKMLKKFDKNSGYNYTATSDFMYGIRHLISYQGASIHYKTLGAFIVKNYDRICMAPAFDGNCFSWYTDESETPYIEKHAITPVLKRLYLKYKISRSEFKNIFIFLSGGLTIKQSVTLDSYKNQEKVRKDISKAEDLYLEFYGKSLREELNNYTYNR